MGHGTRGCDRGRQTYRRLLGSVHNINMQSSPLNAQGSGSYQPPPGIPPGPPSQAAVPSILVQPPPPSFPIPQYDYPHNPLNGHLMSPIQAPTSTRDS